MWSRYTSLIALICLPVLLVSVNGVAAVPHTHHVDGCGTHPQQAERSSNDRDHDAAQSISDSSHGHDHCCVCEHCHDFSFGTMWPGTSQQERGKRVAAALPDLTYPRDDAPLLARWSRPPPEPSSDPLSHLRTVVLLT